MNDFLFIFLILSLISIGISIIFLVRKISKENSISFFSDYLIFPNNERVFYKNIEGIFLRSIYISSKGWEPRIVIKYRTLKQGKEFVIKPHFYPMPSYFNNKFKNDYTNIEELQKLRRYMPNLIDEKINLFLNNEEIKYEELEQMDKMVGVEMIKARGSFRARR